MFLYKKSAIVNATQMLQISSLYQWQEKPIDAILEGLDVFVSAPTSSGKSALFQLPAVAEEGLTLTIVLSPLRALQEDQVNSLHKKGIAAELLNSDLSSQARRQVLKKLPYSMLLYLAPEQLLCSDLQNELSQCTVARVVLDEAHILPQVEANFRKAYQKIGDFIQSLPSRPQVLALTATATVKDRKRIVKALGMENSKTFAFPLRRDNLALHIKRIEEKSTSRKKSGARLNLSQSVERALKDWNGKGRVIIYCPTVKGVKHLYHWLKGRNWPVTKYTGKMSHKKRLQSQERFLSGKRAIVIATNAFGLGIDISNVRLIIHAGLPLSMDGYVQEIGRAGRDGKKSLCLLLYSKHDFGKNQHILRHSLNSKSVQQAFDRLNALHRLVNAGSCIWSGIEKYFGQKNFTPCNNCSHCKSKSLKSQI